MSGEPLSFSVLMPVYRSDRREFFEAAVRSVTLEQTVRPAQLVVVRDGPVPWDVDSALAFVRESGIDVSVVSLEQNVGLSKALNIGLNACCHDVIFRMDSDDVAVPDRFAIQVPLFAADPDLSMSGGWTIQLDFETGERFGYRKVPIEHAKIEQFARTRTPINHMTVGFRRSAVLAAGGYPDYRLPFEDWWLSLAVIKHGGKVSNVADILCHVRTGTDFYARRSGRRYLAMELENLKLMHRAGLMSAWSYWLNLCIRGGIRLLPIRVVRGIYRKLIVDKE